MTWLIFRYKSATQKEYFLGTPTNLTLNISGDLRRESAIPLVTFWQTLPSVGQKRRDQFRPGGGAPPRPPPAGPPHSRKHFSGATYLSFNFFRYSGYIVSALPITASTGMW